MSEICIRSYYAETRDLKYNKEFMQKLITAIAELCESRRCNFNINFDSNDSNHLHVKIVDWDGKPAASIHTSLRLPIAMMVQ